MSLIEVTVRDFTLKLASKAPAPGGGSAAALSGALGAALVSMVCNLTLGKDKYAEFEPLVRDTLATSVRLADELLAGIQRDTDAFDAVMAAFAMPKDSEEAKALRSAQIQSAYKTAVASPQETAENCLQVMRLARGLLHKSNVNAVSDLSVGAMQAFAGLRGALDNVQINLPSIKDHGYVEDHKAWAARLEGEAKTILHEVQAGVSAQIAAD